jgi:hypothetical protein
VASLQPQDARSAIAAPTRDLLIPPNRPEAF